MAVTPFQSSDVASFLELAGTEGWLCEPWEFEFLRESFPQGCLVWREGGRPVAYITSVRYDSSGWIGNLLVEPDYRRRGIGRVLMQQAVAELLKAGVETVWLTASVEGAGLYRNLGFVEVDQILRWTGRGSPRRALTEAPDLSVIRMVDRGGWGDRREALLRLTCNRATVSTSSGGFLCAQRWEHGVQLGPWGCVIGAQARGLLAQAVEPGGGKVFLDVPEKNYQAAELLRSSGYTVAGRTSLMYLGADPGYRPEYVYALGSMGSMG